MIGSLWNNPGEWAATHAEALLRIVLIPLAAWGLTRLLRALIRRLERLVEARGNDSASEQQKRARTIARVLSQMSGILVWSVAAMLVLSELGVNLGPILAGAGIAGLAVGFGAQTLVKDLISGFFLLFENQVRVNDVVTVGDVSGVVEAINLRTTVLRDTDGRVHIVPNGAINVVTNHTRGWSRAVLDVGVSYHEDADRCLAVLREVGAGLARDAQFGARLGGAFEYPGVERLDPSAVVLRMMVPTAPGEQWNVLRELRRRVKKAFDDNGIEIPYPHMTVLVGDESSPVRVTVQRQEPPASDQS